MLATSVLDDAAAWLGLPIVYVITGLGVGLLLERALRLRLSSVALLPLGTCTAMCGTLVVYRLGGHGWLAGALLVLAAAAGLLLSRHELRRRLTPGPAAVAASAVAALYLAPTVLSGNWSWMGYNFLNDTAVQFLLADLLKHYGVTVLEGQFSTRSESLRVYLESSYPLGTHAHEATLAALLGRGVAVVYQGYLAMLMASAALALTGIGRLAGLKPRHAAIAAAVALSANVIYQFGLQGSIKELGALMALTAAALLGNELLAADRPVRGAVAVGIAGAAMINAISVAAGPYLVILAVCLAVSVFVAGSPTVQSRLVPAALAGAITVVVAALPTLISSATFFQSTTTTLAPDSTLTSTLGQLQRPLEVIQGAGVWLSEDYGLPLRSGQIESTATYMLSWLIVLLAVAAVMTFARRRVPGPLPLLIATVITAAAVAGRASPYADAKLLALASPAIVFTAMCGVLSWRGRLRLPALAAGAAAAAGILASAAFAYHGVRVAPVERLEALGDAVAAVENRDWIMLDEVEEFAKYFAGERPRLNVAFEAITPRQAEPFGGGYHLDLDDLEQEYVQSFDAVVVRTGPATSRPPSNFRRIHGNRWYEAWAKDPAAPVLAHYPLQHPLDLGAVPPCRRVRSLAERAGENGQLIVASAPETVRLDVLDPARRPAGWLPLSAPPGVVEPRTPGRLDVPVTLQGGTYDAWVSASTGRSIHVTVDGRRVGSAQGINTQGQWLPAGTITLEPGRHVLGMERPGGGFGPGDGVQSVLGPAALVRRESRELRTVDAADARSLCGKRLDWIEVDSG